jgi:hypothetical protein
MDGCEVQKMKYDMFLGVSKVYRSLKEEEKLEHHSVLNEGKNRNSKNKKSETKALLDALDRLPGSGVPFGPPCIAVYRGYTRLVGLTGVLFSL